MGLAAVSQDGAVLPAGQYLHRGLYWVSKWWLYGSAAQQIVYHTPSRMIRVAAPGIDTAQANYVGWQDQSVAYSLPAGGAWTETPMQLWANAANGVINLKYLDVAFGGQQYFIGRTLFEVGYEQGSHAPLQEIFDFAKPTQAPSASVPSYPVRKLRIWDKRRWR